MTKDTENTDEPLQEEDVKQESEAQETVELTKAEFEAFQSKAQELEGLREKMLRSAADFENAKKRLAKEKEDFVKFSQESFVKDLLPVLDNFERALASGGVDQELDLEELQKQFKGLMSGIEMVRKQLESALQSHGVKEVPTANQVFNPHEHEVIAYVEEDGAEDEIVDEIQKGYKMHDKLIRAAKVRVRVAPKESNSSGSEDGQA